MLFDFVNTRICNSLQVHWADGSLRSANHGKASGVLQSKHIA